MAYGELALKPSEFRVLTPAEFFAMHDGYARRLSDQEEREAKWVTQLVNASGNYKSTVQIETVLGRPLRSTVENAKSKNPRLIEKDAARRNMNIREI